MPRFRFGLLCTRMEIPRRCGNSTWNGVHEGPRHVSFQEAVNEHHLPETVPAIWGISVEKTDSGQGRCGAYMLVGVLNVVMGLSQ